MKLRQQNTAKRDDIGRIRDFNRFYTKQIGVLQEGMLASAYSLTELRIMYELLHGNATTASELAELLGINRGYLSRVLKRFKSLGLIEHTRSAADGRELLLRLTTKGRKIYAPLNERANVEIEQLLKNLSAQEINELLEAMRTIRELLSPDSSSRVKK